MSRIPDLVRDSKLHVQFLPEYTRHVFFESSLASEHRKVRRQEREERWKKTKHLGRGSFGTVWLEQCLTDGREVKVRAVKEIQKSSPNSKPIDYTRELEAIAKFSQPKYDGCFIKSFGWYENVELVYIAMEYLPLGDLQRYIGQPFPETETQQITYQVLEGLAFMHENRFVHRDLKPANIFVVSKGPAWWVKIGDFGISKRAEEGLTELRTLTGTPSFLAPEVYTRILGLVEHEDDLHFNYTFAVDMWSLGMICFHMLTGRAPFERPNSLWSYVEGTLDFPSGILSDYGVSREGSYFVKRLMAAKPENRPTAENTMQLEWLKSQRQFFPSSPFQADTHPALVASELVTSDASAEWSTEDESSPQPGAPTSHHKVGLNKVEFERDDNAPRSGSTVLRDEPGGPVSKHSTSPDTGTHALVLNENSKDEEEKVIGKIDEATARSKHCLGHSLWNQKRYHEAKDAFQQAAKEYEELFGQEHKLTASCVFDIARCLYDMGEYKEAEVTFQCAANRQEKFLGAEDKDTLNSIYWTGCCLYGLEDYREAKATFQRATVGFQKVLGGEHIDTLNSIFCTGHCLYELEDYREAKVTFQRATLGFQKVLGAEHEDTLSSIYWTGRCLYMLQDYKEAEAIFRQAVRGFEETLGEEHEYTIDAIDELRLCLSAQEKSGGRSRFASDSGRKSLWNKIRRR